MIEIERIDSAKLVYLPNAIPSPPDVEHPGLRAELGIAPNAPVAGTVCVLRPQKDVATMVRAMALVHERVAGLRVVIAGDGPDRRELDQLVASLGLTDVVIFLGRRTDVPDVLATLDVAVSSSVFEGAPLAMLEFMEAGLPIVATAVGGVPDLVAEGLGGYLVAPHDPAALGDRVVATLADGARAREMGEYNRRRRREEFDLDTIVRRLEDLYIELYQRSRPAG
jgi:glycosyltransferase involved in cell wall biosynthesis